MTTAQEEPKTGIRFIDKIFFDAGKQTDMEL